GVQTLLAIIPFPNLLDFDIQGLFLVAANGTSVVIYRYSTLLRTYELVQQINASSHFGVGESFGSSVRLSQNAGMLFIGSPTSPSGTRPGIGGSVYVIPYNPSVNLTFLFDLTKIQTVTASGAFLSPNGAFGAFLS